MQKEDLGYEKTVNTKKPPIKSTNGGRLLISENVLDAESQRYYVWAMFILIQAWKGYELFLIHNNGILEKSANTLTENGWSLFSFLNPKLSFLFKYFFLDSLFILAIPFLNIPQLTFTPTFSLMVLFGINALTLLLTFSINFSITSLLYPIYRSIVPEKELAIMEKYMVTDEIINQSQHFKGKKTIRYAPDSSIKINPFNQQFCIRPIKNEKIKIPVKVESTYDLKYLQINYRDFNSIDTVLNYTQRELKSFVVSDYYNSPYVRYDPTVLADSNIQLLEIPIDRAGYYSIKLATDKKEKQIRSYRSDTIIPVCPEASFVEKKPHSMDRCIGESLDDLEISVLGVPPFTLYYEEEIDGKLSKLPPTTVFSSRKIDSPLNSKDFQSKQGHAKFASHYLQDISWAKSYNVVVPLGEKRLQKPGKYIYTINKIVDGFGNVVTYTPHPNDKSTFSSFISHPQSVLKLVDPDPTTPILLNHNKYLNLVISNVDSESPFEVTFQYTPEEKDAVNMLGTFTKVFDAKGNKSILADKPGTYSIIKGNSKYCPCKIKTSSLNVPLAKLPSMDVKLDPIVDGCVGTTGFKFIFDFLGNAPFEIGYKISKLDPNDSRKVLRIEKVASIRSESSSLEHIFKPSTEGSYSIEFMSLSDKNYKKHVVYMEGEHRYVTYFKQRPKAYFSKNKLVQRIKCCHGGASDVVLNIEGKPPFNVTYEIMSPDQNIEFFTLNNIFEKKVKIHTPNFNKGGEHILSLRSVNDSSECDVEFRGQEIHIDVKRDVPELSFYKDGSFEIVKGKSFNVPLNYHSSGLVDLVYSYSSFDNKENQLFTLNSFDPRRGLDFSKEGVYKLVRFKHDGCPGKITNDYELRIQYKSMPSLSIIESQSLKQYSDNVFDKSKVCQNQNDNILFKANGEAPFIIVYDVLYPNGNVQTEMEQINNDNFSLELAATESGIYKYTIKEIFDSIYTDNVVSYLKRSSGYNFKKLEIRHEVAALPEARFLNNKAKIQTCVSNLDNLSQLDPIHIQVDGALPVSLKVDIYHEADGSLEVIDFENIQTNQVDLLSVYENLGLGTHVLTFNQVIDANGCVSDEGILQEQSLTIQVNDIPKIRHLVEGSNQLVDLRFSEFSNYYCVGDQISYILNGIPPFSIDYEFNSVAQHVTVQGNYFKRRAPGPGVLNIKSLSDSSARECRVDYAELKREDLKAYIYDLPSVEIVQGDSVEEDIHEGEQVDITFLLTGTPPFKLTYIRRELDDTSKIVETEVVEDIMSNEYHIMANLEGTYEAIEIQDKFCIARNEKI